MTPHATHITMRSTKPESASGSSGGLLWRYIALDRGMAKQRGELLAASAADVRASLRRIGLQVIDVRRMHRVRRPISIPGLVGSLGTDLRSWWHTRCRAQRAAHRAEFYDSLATMLSSGLALLEAVQTIVESHVDERGGTGERGSGWGSDRAMFVTVRESLREGQSLAQAMLGHPDWFDAIDIAMVEAAQHSGNLPAVLADLSQRQQRSSEIAHKLTGALAYPLLVMLMGLGVVVFLSVKTLPDLTKILADAGIPIPWLTARVMALGQMLAEHWHWLIVAAAVALLARVMLPRMLGCLPINAPAPPDLGADDRNAPAVSEDVSAHARGGAG